MADWRVIPRDLCDTLGEGTLWSARDGAVYWVDILAPAINRLTLDGGRITRWPMPGPVGWIVEREGGGFVAGLKSGLAELSLEPFSLRHVAAPEPHLPGNRMNDGKADASGHIWFGTMDMTEQADCGSLYRIGPGFAWERVDEGYRVPNGPAFSLCGRWLYHSDTARRTVFRFARHEDGSLGGKTPFIGFDDADGYPDGMTVDSENHLWIAHWGGGRISRFDPEGRRNRRITLPARQITSIAFCGERLDRLYASSALVGLGDPTPQDGALFEIDPGVTGVAPGLYRS